MKNIKSIVFISAACLSFMPLISQATPVVVPNPPQLSAKGYV
ncbi:D-alanyl-D-alanine carboxypeptidase, partial [Vibrio anguillarum]|nr:D-alanyl-D-alanine carboxypeptidase [Vibrio anguillarum]